MHKRAMCTHTCIPTYTHISGVQCTRRAADRRRNFTKPKRKQARAAWRQLARCSGACLCRVCVFTWRRVNRPAPLAANRLVAQVRVCIAYVCSSACHVAKSKQARTVSGQQACCTDASLYRVCVFECLSRGEE
jgi:hypothetical protein